MIRIGVIGAGINGLSSAINAQKAFPNTRVTIIADQFGPETLSYHVGGLFRPNLEHLVRGDNGPLMRQCVRDSWEHYSSLARSKDAKESGQMFVAGMMVHRKPTDIGYEVMKECAFDFHHVPTTELKRRGIPKEFEYGYACTTVISQPSIYMEWLMKEFKMNGGETQRRKVNRIEELYGEFQLIINCCGLAAQTLVNDKECFPIRGQLVYVKAPWIKQFYFSDVDVYLIPHFDKIVVGGVRLKGDGNTEADLETQKTILRNAEAIFPELKGAEIIKGWAGSRPGRTQLRLETEILDVGDNRKLPVIHNYGHAGHGITLSWGTAIHAVKLAKDALVFYPKAAL